MYTAAVVAARVARHSQRTVIVPTLRRCLATATITPETTSTTSHSSTNAGPISFSNVEAKWTQLSAEEKASIHEQLEEIQKKDWKELNIEEKKAAYYVAFGPHGPRAPTSAPGDSFKVLLYTIAAIGAAGGLFFGLRNFGQPPPKTMTKEWEEATNERALEMKLNPITGISSEGYKGKGFVQTK